MQKFKKMMKFLLKNPTYSANVDFSLLLLRIATGGFMLSHGFIKLTKLMADQIEFADPIGLGPELSLVLVFFSEVICALFILLGILPRLAAIPLIITMIVIVFVVHGGDAFGKQELPLFYLIGYLIIFLLGSGKYSIQTLMNKK
jgi:putative oxidoreductase